MTKYVVVMDTVTRRTVEEYEVEAATAQAAIEAFVQSTNAPVSRSTYDPHDTGDIVDIRPVAEEMGE